MTTYKITESKGNGETLSVSASRSVEVGTRKDENMQDIPIIETSVISLSILLTDLPAEHPEVFVKTKVEEAYIAQPDQTFAKWLKGQTWTTIGSGPRRV